MDASSAVSVNILETFNMYQYLIYISAPTISTSLDFCDLVPVKGRLMCMAYVQTWFSSLCFFCPDLLSHLTIDASSWIKLLMNHCVKYVTINRMCRSITIF